MFADDKFGFGGGTPVETLIDEEIPQDLEGTGGDFEFTEPTGGGLFPPRILPGPVRFRFEFVRLEEQESNDSLHTLRNGKVPKIFYNAHVQNAELQPGKLLRDTGEPETTIRFNEAGGFKSQAMQDKNVSTDIERLYTTLGLLAEFGPPKSLDQMVTMIQNASGRIGSGAIGWNAAVKTDKTNERGKTIYEVFASKPNTARGEKRWPRGEDGKLQEQVTFEDGTVKTAREQIVSLYAPKKETQ